MNKYIIPAVILLLLFSSCETTPSSSSSSSNNRYLYDFNDSLPDEQTALIHYAGVNIIEYNGIGIEWKSRIGGFIQLRIPGGDTVFVLDGTTGSYNMGYTTYNQVPFKYKFENGKEYTMIISQNHVNIYNGKQSMLASLKTHIVTYAMSNKGQTITWQDGKRVNN
ncbi:MAG: hypothetical protein FWB77_03100 [Treponema sp.]|nr:hypothetical protein [Treponema sp.]